MSRKYKCYECPSVDFDEYDDTFWCTELEKEVSGLITEPKCPLYINEDT